MRFVDTNVFLRYLVNDVPRQADACEALFRRAVAGKESLCTTDLVVAEIVWVLESYYELAKADIRAKVEKILNTKNLTCPGKDVILDALALYVEKNIDYVDAYNAAWMKMKSMAELYSFDAHYDRIGWLQRIKPGG